MRALGGGVLGETKYALSTKSEEPFQSPCFTTGYDPAGTTPLVRFSAVLQTAVSAAGVDCFVHSGFFCYDANLVVEVDGSQHFTPEMMAYDTARTAYFHTLGIRVLRVDNEQINRDFSGVCGAILLEIRQCGVTALIETGE